MAVPRPGLGAQLCQRRHHSIPVQFGYRTTLQDDPYPRAFSVGGFYVTGSYADPLLNADGQNRVLFGGEPKMDYGSSQVYIQAQQMVYPPDASDRGLTVFGGANWTTSGQPNVERVVFAGTYYKGAFAPRPSDTLGVAVSLVDVTPASRSASTAFFPNPLAARRASRRSPTR